MKIHRFLILYMSVLILTVCILISCQKDNIIVQGGDTGSLVLQMTFEDEAPVDGAYRLPNQFTARLNIHPQSGNSYEDEVGINRIYNSPEDTVGRLMSEKPVEIPADVYCTININITADGVTYTGIIDTLRIPAGGTRMKEVSLRQISGTAYIIGSCDTPDYASGVAVAGGCAFVADEEYGLQIIRWR